VAHYGPGAVFTFVDGYLDVIGTTETLITFTREAKWLKLYNDDAGSDALLYRVRDDSIDDGHHQATLSAGTSIELPLAASGIYLEGGAAATPYRIVVLG
jgi:hypothetical protein